MSQTPFGIQARNYSIKIDLFNTTSISANNNFFTQDLTTDIWPAGEWSIYVSCAASGILTLKRKQIGGSTTVSEKMNSGTALSAGAPYAFSFFVSKGESINFQYSVDSVIGKLVIEETVNT